MVQGLGPAHEILPQGLKNEPPKEIDNSAKS